MDDGDTLPNSAVLQRFKSAFPSINYKISSINRGDGAFDAWGNTHRSIEFLIQFSLNASSLKGDHDRNLVERFVSAAFRRSGALHETNRRLGGIRAEMNPASEMPFEGALQRPLWLGEVPEEISRDWETLVELLNQDSEHWGFLIDWYSDRLLGAPANVKLEREIMEIPNIVWDAGPANVNDEVTRLIHKFGSENSEETEEFKKVGDHDLEQVGILPTTEFVPPDPELAPVRLFVDDGVLQIQRQEIAQLADIAQDGWAVLSEEIDDLAAQLGSQNNDLFPRLMRARRALGDTFEEFSAIRFGLAAMTIEQFAQEAENLGMLMPEQAAPLRSIVLQKNLLLRHAPEWADYVAALEPPLADAETEQDAAMLAAEIAREIVEAHPEAIASDTAEALEELAAATDVEPTPENPDGIASAEDRRSWLRAFSEEMRAFSVDVVLEYRKLAVKGIAATAATGSIAIVTSVSTKLLGLADKLPASYAWLKDLVYFAASIVGA